MTDKMTATIDLPTLFDSDEPLFLTAAAAEEATASAMDTAALSYDGTGDEV